MVVPAFSSGRLGPTRVPVPAKSGGLPRDSVLYCEQVTTIDKELLQRGPWDLASSLAPWRPWSELSGGPSGR